MRRFWKAACKILNSQTRCKVAILLMRGMEMWEYILGIYVCMIMDMAADGCVSLTTT